MLIMAQLHAMSWALSGAAIAAITLLLLFAANRRLGVSGGFENLCALASRQPLFRRAGRHGWRLLFIAGLVCGGVLSRVLAGAWSPIWALGMFDGRIGWGPVPKLLWMFGGGLLIGFGTRLANGCTSGHGIFGLAHGERSGLVATLAFMAAGVATTNLVYRVVFP